jgi:hypothetical protein
MIRNERAPLSMRFGGANNLPPNEVLGGLGLVAGAGSFGSLSGASTMIDKANSVC